MANVATRLISIILMLQSRGTLKACDLAEELGVSERTIHRYMGMLDELGIPIYSERGPYGGFSLVRGYKLPPLVFSPEEATALYLGTELVKDIWGASYQEAVVAATAKLDNVLPDALLQEVKQVQRSLL
ncbi:MAG: helix-turn-helix transcriptional regulator, partial [Anaerolineae bacterium]